MKTYFHFCFAAAICFNAFGVTRTVTLTSSGSNADFHLIGNDGTNEVTDHDWDVGFSGTISVRFELPDEPGCPEPYNLDFLSTSISQHSSKTMSVNFPMQAYFSGSISNATFTLSGEDLDPGSLSGGNFAVDQGSASGSGTGAYSSVNYSQNFSTTNVTSDLSGSLSISNGSGNCAVSFSADANSISGLYHYSNWSLDFEWGVGLFATGTTPYVTRAEIEESRRKH